MKIENSQSGRGSNASGNFVRILHEDGTMGVYLHLMRGSVSVREGQRVSVGTALARSGNTGNSTGPHLHFVVQRNSGNELISIPYEFATPCRACPTSPSAGIEEEPFIAPRPASDPEPAALIGQSSFSTLARTIFGPFIF